MTSVLVVDDERQILRALAINLRARGYDIRTARSGDPATRTRRAACPGRGVDRRGVPHTHRCRAGARSSDTGSPVGYFRKCVVAPGPCGRGDVDVARIPTCRLTRSSGNRGHLSMIRMADDDTGWPARVVAPLPVARARRRSGGAA